MCLVLVGVGVVLLGLGVFVLLKRPSLPGGKLEFHGIRVDSAGAGLPLIVLGLVTVILGALQSEPAGPPIASPTRSGSPQAPPPSSTRLAEPPSPSPSPEDSSPSGGSQSPEPGTCVEEWLDRHPKVDAADRRKLLVDRAYDDLYVGLGDVGLIFLRGEETIGVMRLGESVDETDFVVRQVVDELCRPVEWKRHKVEEGGIWDDFRVTFALQNRPYVLDYTAQKGDLITKAILRAG